MSPSSDLISMLPKSYLWPNAIRTAFFKRHMTNVERFKVTVFFLANGVPPHVIVNAYRHRFNFDKSAYRQVDWIIRTYPTSKWKAWNVMERRSI
jgi:hypothetical protein